MIVTSTRGTIPTKHVRVEGIEPSAADEDVIAFAMRAAGESRDSLFGWHIERYGEVAHVALYTD